MHFLPFKTIKTLMLRMDHAKLLDVLTSLPVSRSILPRAQCFATSRPANHAICSFIHSSGYASGPIRRCLFKDYIINTFIDCHFFPQVSFSHRNKLTKRYTYEPRSDKRDLLTIKVKSEISTEKE